MDTSNLRDKLLKGWDFPSRPVPRGSPSHKGSRVDWNPPAFNRCFEENAEQRIGSLRIWSKGERKGSIRLVHVQGLCPHRLPGGIQGDLLDPGLGLAQQLLAASLQRFAALIDRHRLLERHLALFEPFHDRFKLLDRPLKRQFLDVGAAGVGHCEPLANLWLGAVETSRNGTTLI